MQFTFVTLLAATVALAAPSKTTGDRPSLVTRSETTHTVVVDQNGFSPSSVNPTKGDAILFHFSEGFHSVIESTYSEPCEPLQGGFASGEFITAMGDGRNKKGFVIDVFNTDPVWFYNGSQGQCHKFGAVGVSFSPDTNTHNWEDFRARALEKKRTTNVKKQTGGYVVIV
ncbi:uncharacterized protein BROUX77_004223 [Berkeleyomyces rouxiae]|uniref:uncharacterized protein n=1 Tax=Berkeleyomyces rouxiae TaxID=2035830 RepID=UPI003B76A058